MGGEVELPQVAGTPVVAKEPWGNEMTGGPTATEVGPGEDRQRRGGGDENPLTA